MATKDINDFLQQIDRWLWKAGYDSDEITWFIAVHSNEIDEAFKAGTTVDDFIQTIKE